MIAPAALRALVQSTLAGTPATLRALLTPLPINVIEMRLDDGWSPKDVVAHLVDVDQDVFLAHISQVLAQDRPSFPEIDPTARLLEGGYAAAPLSELLDRLNELRTRDREWLDTIDWSRLDRVGRYEEAGEFTASQLLHYWAYHDLNHLAQISSMLRSALGPVVGDVFDGV